MARVSIVSVILVIVMAMVVMVSLMVVLVMVVYGGGIDDSVYDVYVGAYCDVYDIMVYFVMVV